MLDFRLMPLHHLFKERVDEDGAAAAVMHGSVTWSRRQLLMASNRIVTVLKKHGAKVCKLYYYY